MKATRLPKWNVLAWQVESYGCTGKEMSHPKTDEWLLK